MTTIAINNRPKDTLGFIYEMKLRDAKQLSKAIKRDAGIETTAQQ